MLIQASRRLFLIALACGVGSFAPNQARAQCSPVVLTEFGGEIRLRGTGDLVFAGDLGLVARGEHGLDAIDASDPLQPRLSDQLVVDGMPIEHVAADGTHAVASSGATLLLIDISVSTRLELLDTLTLPHNVRALELHGATLFVADEHGLRVCSITSGATIEQAGSLATASAAVAISVRDDLCYLLTESTGLVVHVANPAAPMLLAGNAPTGVTVDLDGAYAYVGDQGIKIVSLAAPASPVVVNTLSGSLAPDRCIALDAENGVLVAMFRHHGDQPCCDDCHSYLTDLRVHALDVSNVTSVSMISGQTYGYATGSDILQWNGYACYSVDEVGVAFAPIQSPWKAVSAVSMPLNNAGDQWYSYEPLRLEDSIVSLQRLLPTWSLNGSTFAFVTTDLSWPERPTVSAVGLNDLWTHGYRRLAALHNGVAYVTGFEAARADGPDCAEAPGHGVLATIDLTNPSQPVLLDKWRMPHSDIAQLLGNVVIDGPIAYVWATSVVENVDTYVFDISDPADLQVITSYPWGFGLVSQARDGMLIVQRGGTALLVDAADPFNPVEVGVLPVNGRMRWNADQLLVFGHAFSVIDMSNPTDPIVIGSVPIPPTGTSLQLSVDGTLAACRRQTSSDGQTVFLIDFSDASHPRIIAQLDAPKPDGMILLNGVLVQVPVDGTPMRIYDINGDITLARLASIDTLDTSFGVASHRDLAFVSDYSAGLRIFNVSNPADPVDLGSYDTPDRAYQTVIVEEGDSTLACVADGSTGLLVLDVTDPGAPTPVSSLATSDLALALAVEGDFAYLACRFEGLQIADITNPGTPVLVGSVDTPGSAQSVTIDGQLAYVADGSGGVHVIDISNRSLPAIIGTYDTPSSAREALIRGPVAYIPDRTTGLIALDISDPTDPRHISTLAGLGDARSITDFGHLAFVADFNGLMHMIDIADPLNMLLLQSTPTLGTARAITNDAGTIYLADGDAGLTILEARPCWYRPCPADLNDDHSLNFFDVQMFLNAYAASDGLADWNDDGHINFFDVQRYLGDFSEGCVF